MLPHFLRSCLAMLLLLCWFPASVHSQCIDATSVTYHPLTAGDDYTNWWVTWNDGLDFCNLSGSGGTDSTKLECGPTTISGQCTCVAPCGWTNHTAYVRFEVNIPADATITSARFKLWRKGSSTSDLDKDIRISIAGESGYSQLGYGHQNIDQDVSWLMQSAIDDAPQALVFLASLAHEGGASFFDSYYSFDDGIAAYMPALEVSYTAPKQAEIGYNAATCTPGNDGDAAVSSITGTAPFSYLWSSGQTTAQINNLGIGAYTVTITDANGCTILREAEITEPGAPELLLEPYPESCTTGSDGHIAAAVVNGGTATYTYAWDAGAGNQTADTAFGLSTGTYSVTVSNINGCDAVASASVQVGGIPSGHFTTWPADCGDNNGDARVFPSGGTAPYTYNWANNVASSTSFVAHWLTAGSYSCTVTDAVGCTRVFDDMVMFEKDPPIVATSSTLTTCGGNDGTATATVTPNCSSCNVYKWDAAAGSQTTQTATGLAAGTYTIMVVDTFDRCTTITRAVVSEPAFVHSKSIRADVTSHDVFWEKNVQTGVATHTNNTQLGVVELPWQDRVGHTYLDIDLQLPSAVDWITGDLKLYFPTTQTQNAKYIRPYPISTAWDEATFDPNAPPAVDSSVYAGLFYNGTTTYAKAGLGPMLENMVASGNTYHGFRISSGTANHHEDYFASSEHGTVGVRPLLTVEYNSFVASIVSKGCGPVNDGAISINITEGVAPYTYQWGQAAQYQTTATVTGLASGDYLVTVTDANGCRELRDIHVPSDAPVVSFNVIDYTCVPTADGVVSVTGSGGMGDLSYQWSANAGGGTGTTLTNLFGGTYTVTVTDTAGCFTVDSVTVGGSWHNYSAVQSYWAHNVQDTWATLKWAPICGAVSYKIQYKVAGPNSWNTVWKYANVGSRVLQNLTSGTVYKYRIQVQYPNGPGPWTPVGTFITLSTACTNTSFTTTSPVGGIQARCIWQPVSNAVSYKLRYRALGGNWTVVSKSANKVWHWLTGLQTGTMYEWQVKTLCAYGNITGTPWGTVTTFTTLGTPKQRALRAEGPELAVEARLWPNPTSGLFNVQLEGSAVAHDYVLFDALGRTVTSATLAGTAGRFQVQTYNLADGVYTLRVRHSAGILRKSVVVRAGR